MYGDGLLDALSIGGERHVRLRDGTSLPLSLERWLGPADAIDEELLDSLIGPVLDVGCGPGRHLRALAARGVFALGVDLSPVAVELAVDRGARAIVGDIFSELPGGRTWSSALLLDGNIGIGGSPVRLLTRIATLLSSGGQVLVEVESPRGSTGSTLLRIEHAGQASPWFAWARVAAPGIEAIACASGFTTTEIWTRSGRWFARLRRVEGARAGPGSAAGTAVAAGERPVP